MDAPIYHPLALAVLCASVGTCAVFAWMAITHLLDHQLTRARTSLAYALFTVSGALNAGVVAATLVPTAPSVKTQIFRLVWVFGALGLCGWILAVQTFADLRDPKIRLMRRALVALACVPAVDAVWTALGGTSRFFSPVPRPSDWSLLLANGNVYSHLPLADLTAVLLVVVAIASTALMLRELWRDHREERLLMAGVLLTALMGIVETFLGGSGTPIPLLFLANYAEAMRITWASNHRVGAQLEALAREHEANEALIEHQVDLLHTQGKLASVGEQTARITHDLRNPLSAALAGVDLVEEVARQEPVDREELDEALVLTRKALDQVLQLVRRVTRQARRDSLEPTTPVVLGEVASEAVTLTSHRLRGVPVEIAIPPGLAVQAKRSGLVRVLVNLLLNAGDALTDHPAPWIRLEGHTDGERVRLDVVDAGDRPPDRVLESMFRERFTTREEGTGLGLQICRRQVEADGGTIEVDRKAAHTTFHVALRRAL